MFKVEIFFNMIRPTLHNSTPVNLRIKRQTTTLCRVRSTSHWCRKIVTIIYTPVNTYFHAEYQKWEYSWIVNFGCP